jgi:hypothetical protein
VIADPGGEDGQRYREILENFNPVMAAMQKTSFTDYNFGGSFGNQIPLERVTLGYNFGVWY